MFIKQNKGADGQKQFEESVEILKQLPTIGIQTISQPFVVNKSKEIINITIEFYKLILRIQENHFGENHYTTASTLFQIANLHYLSDNVAEALIKYK